MIKKGIKTSLKIIIYSLATLRKTGTASDLAIKKYFDESGIANMKQGLIDDFVGKYVYINPKSSPSNIIWGKVEEIKEREAGEFDLVIKHLKHNFLAYVRNDNIAIPFIFNEKKDLLDWIEKEIENGNIRVGSLRITAMGAKKYTREIYESLMSLLFDQDAEIINLFPHDPFRDALIRSGSVFTSEKNFFDELTRKPDIMQYFTELGMEEFLHEIIILDSFLNKLYEMKTIAILSEYNYHHNNIRSFMKK